MSKNLDVPIWEKLNLTIDEAAAYSNISRKWFDKILKDPCCPFALAKGSHTLVKRKELERYLEKINVI